jgi:hypothetical protein
MNYQSALVCIPNNILPRQAERKIKTTVEMQWVPVTKAQDILETKYRWYMAMPLVSQKFISLLHLCRSPKHVQQYSNSTARNKVYCTVACVKSLNTH